MQTLLFAGAFFCVLNTALAFGNGSIEESCQTMAPTHGVQPGGPCPYQISLLSSDVEAGATVAMKLSGPPFRGFMIQVRDVNGNAVGYFKTDPNKKTAHLLDCFGKPGSSISHNSRQQKSEITVYWIAPALPHEICNIWITVAVTQEKVWKKQSAGKITIH